MRKNGTRKEECPTVRPTIMELHKEEVKVSKTRKEYKVQSRLPVVRSFGRCRLLPEDGVPGSRGV